MISMSTSGDALLADRPFIFHLPVATCCTTSRGEQSESSEVNESEPFESAAVVGVWEQLVTACSMAASLDIRAPCSRYHGLLAPPCSACSAAGSSRCWKMKEHSSRHWSKLFHAVFTVAPAVRVPSSGVGECARTMRSGRFSLFRERHVAEHPSIHPFMNSHDNLGPQYSPFMIDACPSNHTHESQSPALFNPYSSYSLPALGPALRRRLRSRLSPWSRGHLKTIRGTAGGESARPPVSLCSLGAARETA